jgi:hypothetical protein
MIQFAIFGQGFLTKILFNSAKGTTCSVQSEGKKDSAASVDDSLFVACFVSRNGDSESRA